MKIFSRIIFSLLFVTYSNFYAQDINPDLEAGLQNIIDNGVLEVGGISACVIMPNGAIWQGVAGNSHDGVPITPDMHFIILSNTKTFISTLVMMLVEEGTISLDDILYNWLPEYPNVNSSITIRQLLNHTSGIFDYISHPQYINSLFENPGFYWSPDYILNNYVSKPYFSPGSGWAYSSTNYILAGLILKEAYETDTLSSVLHEKIFNPLDLNNTYLGYEDIPIGITAHQWSNFTGDSHRDDLTSISDTAILSSIWTAGGIISDSRDMAVWIKALYTGDLVSQASIEEMIDFVPADWGTPLVPGYGLGTTLIKIDGDSLYGHGGYFYGSNSEIAYNPKNDISIAVLMNRDSFDQWPQWSDLIVRDIYRLIVRFPASLFEYEVLSQLEVQFTDKSSGMISDWLWDFGDGNRSTETNPSHTYNQEGIYTVSLTVSGPYGSDSSAQQIDVVTGLAEDENNIPVEYALSQNYPNPFNPTTNIEFSIPKSEFVTLKVYNILGEEVATLVSERLPAGNYKYDWDASSLASGVYLYKIQAGNYVEAKKMILMK